MQQEHPADKSCACNARIVLSYSFFNFRESQECVVALQFLGLYALCHNALLQHRRDVTVKAMVGMTEESSRDSTRRARIPSHTKYCRVDVAATTVCSFFESKQCVQCAHVSVAGMRAQPAYAR